MNVLSDLMLGTISFPGLGLEFEIDRIAFTIGKFSVYWYAIFIVGAMVISGIIAMIQCKKYGIKDEDVLDNLLFALPAAIIGARMYYVVFEWASLGRKHCGRQLRQFLTSETVVLLYTAV
ncbi:MAG: prolipoprotein diacylglyceryl transferase [Clostridia bacterium]|nr:prolipoprotein diacylglyceryl transferase [Clostridia bacterium]